MASHTWWWCLSAVVFVGCSNVDSDVDTREQQSGLVCGMEVLPSPQTVPVSACVNGRTVFGPAHFEVSGHGGRNVTAEFATGGGELCITATASGAAKARHGYSSDHARGRGHDEHGNGNGYGHTKNSHNGRHTGDDVHHGPSTAKANVGMYLDGEEIAKPRDLSGPSAYQESTTLNSGTHELGLRIAGQRGSSVDVEIREAFDSLETDLELINDDGSLKLTAVATDHPLLTPNGDGHHDDTFFSALVEPLNFLPGKTDGTVAYFLNYEFSIVDLDSCGTLDTNITGTKQVNSPTRVTASWDGTDASGNLLPDGNYAYVFSVTLVDQFGTTFGSVQGPAYGFIIDAAPADYTEDTEYLGSCDPVADPTNCRCPGSGGIPGSGDPNCSFGMVQHLLDGSGFPAGTQGNFYDPSVIDLSFITTTQDPATGRYRVTVDLRTVFGGGLVSKGSGVWDSEATLRQWVSDMTGVPVSTGDSLFNFDYVQLGQSTGVHLLGKSNHSFNHFLLDAMTDDDGFITIDGVTTDLAGAFNGDSTAPTQYVVESRVDDECSESANSNGVDDFRAKFCAHNTAVPIGSTTDLGIYTLRASLFDIQFNGQTATQDELCLLNGIFSCGIRTVRVPADTLQIESTYYVQASGAAQVQRTDVVELADAATLSLAADRGDGADGVCSRAVATRDGLAVRIDSADGSVPESCLINGVIPY